MGIGLKRTIGGAIISAVSGLGVLVSLDNPASREKAADALEAADAALKQEAQAVGVECARVIDLYFQDPGLIEAPTEARIAELQNDPRKPCGNVPIEIRRDYNRYAGMMSGKMEAQRVLNSEISEQEGSLENRRFFAGTMTGGGVIAMVGANRLRRQRNVDPHWWMSIRERMSGDGPLLDEPAPKPYFSSLRNRSQRSGSKSISAQR